MSRKSWIDIRDPGSPLAHIEIDQCVYQFRVPGLPQPYHENFINVLEKYMQDVHNRAVAKTRIELQDKLKQLIGIK